VWPKGAAILWLWLVGVVIAPDAKSWSSFQLRGATFLFTLENNHFKYVVKKPYFV
jgi:hypothetical protein